MHFLLNEFSCCHLMVILLAAFELVQPKKRLITGIVLRYCIKQLCFYNFDVLQLFVKADCLTYIYLKKIVFSKTSINRDFYV